MACKLLGGFKVGQCREVVQYSEIAQILSDPKSNANLKYRPKCNGVQNLSKYLSLRIAFKKSVPGMPDVLLLSQREMQDAISFGDF